MSIKRAIAGLLLFGAPAAAQDPILALDPTTMIGYAGTVAADQYARREFGSQVAQRRPSEPSTNSAAYVARLSFRPDPTVRQRVYARAVAQAQKNDPAEAAKLRQLLQSGVLTRDVRAYLGRYGMSTNNVADTTALYLALAWQIANGTPNDPSRAQMLGLRNQVASTFAGMPEFVRADQAVRQDLSEANLIQAAYAANIGNAMEKDRRLLPRARAAMVKGVMSLYGLDLRNVTLTAQGLR
jgi:hypothetical protein